MHPITPHDATVGGRAGREAAAIQPTTARPTSGSSSVTSVVVGDADASTASGPPCDVPLDPPLYPPTVPPVTVRLPFVVRLPDMIQNPIRVYPEELYTGDGLLARPFLGTDMYWVTAPALVEQILLSEADAFAKSHWETRVLGPMIGNGVLTAMGASWRFQRKASAPLFRHADILGHVPAIVAATETQIARWQSMTEGNRSVTDDIEQVMKEATFDVIATTILAGITPDEARVVKAADVAYMRHITWEFAAIVLKLPEWVWHPGKRDMEAAAVQLRAAMRAIVARRRAEIETSNIAPTDVVGRLAAARHPDTGEPMPDDMVVNNLGTFLEAGHQTTAQALTWALYLLARSPGWQHRLRAEIRAVVGDRKVEAADLARLPLTTRMLKETMRLYPPVATIVRVATRSIEVGGRRVRPGSILIVPLFALHRRRSLWADADRFDPDRFLPEREATFERAQYIPFGFGPRTCLGMPLAMAEGVAILATVLQKMQFAWDGHHRPEPVSAIVLRPRGGMPLKVSAVDGAAA